MKIGYPCINRSLGCTASSTFRLRNLCDERLVETVAYNLTCLHRILNYNVENELYFFRISSDLIPFASHPECTFDWPSFFSPELRNIGAIIKRHSIRISMHPDQFVLINAKKSDIVDRSIQELHYHARVLDALGLTCAAKIQIHVGGMYGEKQESIRRFIDVYKSLDRSVRRRLVIENDDNRFTASDCLRISNTCGIPVLFDNFHHRMHNSGEKMPDMLKECAATWRKSDGAPMTDYSSQQPGARPGAHVRSIDTADFRSFLRETLSVDFDIMLEIKDKEASALQAMDILRGDPRCFREETK